MTLQNNKAKGRQPQKQPATFSGRIKQELMKIDSFSCPDCAYAFCYGLLCFSPRAKRGYIWTASSRTLAELAAQSLAEAGGYIVTVVPPQQGKSGMEHTYRLLLQNPEDRKDFQTRFLQISAEWFCTQKLGKHCCMSSFLRGVFLSCGTVMDPKRQYHLEFLCPGTVRGMLLKNLLATLNFTPGLTERKQQCVVYFKDSEQIEDLLTTMGAGLGAMEYMNAKIEKEVRNQANRATNCDTANIQKIINAAGRQVEDIRLIQRTKGLDYLNSDLRQTALARLEHPDSSLGELCQLLGGDLTRSGLNHRLQKISRIADSLREDEHPRV